MRTRVIGVGFSKTGTSTLATCLETLGFRHLGFDGDITEAAVHGDPGPALDALKRYDSAADWPWPLLYDAIDAAYPGSRFILTVRRDAETWVGSLKRQAEKKPGSIYREMVYGYDNPHGHEQELIEQYERHNDAVRRYFADRPGQFLEVCWETGSDWGELCRFLDLPVPRAPVPHANRSRLGARRLLSKLRFALGGR